MSEQHGHEPLGLVLGTRCNVCDAPLVVAGCPLCVTCCEREPDDDALDVQST